MLPFFGGITKGLGDNVHDVLGEQLQIEDWTQAKNVLPHMGHIINTLKRVYKELEGKQTPFLLQPIWKTKGKSPVLSDKCLDVFFWSDAGFISFVTEVANLDRKMNEITRQKRTAIWLYKMLCDAANNEKFNHAEIIDSLSYNTRNDKAFSTYGAKTNAFMRCERLASPVIDKCEIKNIILGGGHEMLSPERRFDAIIVNSPELFK